MLVKKKKKQTGTIIYLREEKKHFNNKGDVKIKRTAKSGWDKKQRQIMKRRMGGIEKIVKEKTI